MSYRKLNILEITMKKNLLKRCATFGNEFKIKINSVGFDNPRICLNPSIWNVLCCFDVKPQTPNLNQCLMLHTGFFFQSCWHVADLPAAVRGRVVEWVQCGSSAVVESRDTMQSRFSDIFSDNLWFSDYFIQTVFSIYYIK